MTDLKAALDTLDVAEAYGLAVQIEEDGYKLYDKVAGMTKDDKAKQDLIFLRDQEKGHKAYFEKLLKESGTEYNEKPDSPLHAWVKENLMTPAQDALKTAPANYKEALTIGIKLEERSVRFYTAIKKAAESKEIKKAVTKIIKEEKRHRKFISIVLKYSGDEIKNSI